MMTIGIRIVAVFLAAMSSRLGGGGGDGRMR